MAKFKSRLKKGTAAAAIAVTMIGGFEGLRLVSYTDIVGIWTACYGETKNIGPGMKFTKAECDDMLLEGIERHEYGMRLCMKDPDGIPIESYISFVSFTYNLGVGAFCGSTLSRKLNKGDLVGACSELKKWTKARVGGILRVVRGLVRRRDKEYNYCMEGVKNA